MTDAPKRVILPAGAPEGANTADAWQPTGEMRWLDTEESPVLDPLQGHFVQMPKILQQRWIDTVSGRCEWRDVPKVRSSIAAVSALGLEVE